MKPMWLTSRNDSSRFRSFWASAPSAPTTIVSAAITSSRIEGPSCGKINVWVRSSA